MMKQKSNSETRQKNPTAPSIKRQLSVFYTAPDGRLTSDDPNSYQGEERVAYQNALMNQHPETGYADGIVAERAKTSGFFAPKKKEECADIKVSAPAFKTYLSVRRGI